MQNQQLTDCIRFIALILLTVVVGGCATPTYEDGTPREYSDMPWNTPASWEGSVGVPGLGGDE